MVVGSVNSFSTWVPWPFLSVNELVDLVTSSFRSS